jgi:hypothetical protein
VIIGTVQVGNGIKVDAKLFQVKSGQSAFGREYQARAPTRGFTPTLSDDIHEQQRGLCGVARTKPTFSSVATASADRHHRAARRQRVHLRLRRREPEARHGHQSPNITDLGARSRSIAYRRTGAAREHLHLEHFLGTLEEVTKGPSQNFCPCGRPTARHAFSSTRDGNPEIYVANRDGSTPGSRTIPASTSCRPGRRRGRRSRSRRIDRGRRSSTIGVDGSACRKSPRVLRSADVVAGAHNEIAYRRDRGRFDIKVIELATRQVRQLTFGEGTNEPVLLVQRTPSRLHVHPVGKSQIFTIAATART